MDASTLLTLLGPPALALAAFAAARSLALGDPPVPQAKFGDLVLLKNAADADRAQRAADLKAATDASAAADAQAAACDAALVAALRAAGRPALVGGALYLEDPATGSLRVVPPAGPDDQVEVPAPAPPAAS